MKNKLFPSIIVAFIAFTLSSCGQAPTAREYQETVVAPAPDPHDFIRNAPFMRNQSADLPPSMQLPAGADSDDMQAMLDASVAELPLSWKTPQEWTEERGSGMRLATFRDQDNLVQCTIISLGGQAGGLQSNVARWIGQIGATVPAGDAFNTFLARQERVKAKGGFELTMIDLSEFAVDDQSPSMIAAIAELEDKTIFIKMTGNRKDSAANKALFEALCKSLDIN